MADKWIDIGASGSNNGSSPANAWTNWRTALQTAQTPGDKIWVKRALAQSLGASTTTTPSGNGTSSTPITVIGWPRPSRTGTATFTNDSTTVSSCNVTVTFRSFCGRWIKCDADGGWYLITAFLSSSSFVIDRPYAGTTVETAAFTIKEDEDYATRPQAGIDAGWDSSGHDLFETRGTTADYAVLTSNSSNKYWWFKNISLYRSNSGHIWNIDGGIFSGTGLLFSWLSSFASASYAINIVTASVVLNLDRFVIVGPTVANTAYGTILTGYAFALRNGAVYGVNMGIACTTYGEYHFENINVGVEAACAGRCITYSNVPHGNLTGKDVKLSHTTEANRLYIAGMTSHEMATVKPMFGMVNIENYQKIRGQIYRVSPKIYTSMAVDTSTTDPRKRTGGGSSVIATSLASCGSGWGPPDYDMIPCPVFEQRIFQKASTTKTYRVYVQSTQAINSGLLTVRVDYLHTYSSITMYTDTFKIGKASISARSGVTDWSQYVEVTDITVPIDCAVMVRLFCSAYNASGSLYIDPLVAVI